MPYLNDRLAENEAMNTRERLATIASRTSRFTFEPEVVIAELRQHIIGQEEVISAMSDMLYVLKADFSETNRPLSVNLFLGPTGVGKTETVRVLSKALLGDANSICRIDMNTLAQEHYAAALTGAPPGYVGSKEGHTLFNTEAVEGTFSRPGIVLFDEIEKASKEVIRSILNILDTGILRLAGGTKTVNFSNALVFMTSNIGARELAAYQRKLIEPWWRCWSKGDSKKEAWNIVEPILKKTFDPEFLNRIERKILFNCLDLSVVDNIISLEVEKLNLRLARKNIEIALDSSAQSKIASYYNQEYGARNIAQHIRVKLNPSIAKAIVNNTAQQRFTIVYRNDDFSLL